MPEEHHLTARNLLEQMNRQFNDHITIQAPAPEKGSKASAKTEAADKPKKEPKIPFLLYYYEMPFIVSWIRFFLRSTLKTFTSTISPTLTTSSGCLINFLSVISEICTRPS